MDIGLSTYTLRHAAGLWGYLPEGVEPLSPEGYLRIVNSLDLEGAHFVDMRHFPTTTRGYLADLASLADDLDLYTDIGVQGTEPEALESALEVGNRLGSRVVSVGVGASRQTPGVDWTEVLATATARIAALVPMLEDTEIRLAVRCAGDLTSEEALRIVEAAGSELVGVCLDPVRSLLVLEPPCELATRLAHRAHSLELGDAIIEPRPDGCLVTKTILGAGVIDNDGLIGVLAKRDRGVRLNIETPVEQVRIPYRIEGWRRAFGEEAVARFDAWVHGLPVSAATGSFLEPGEPDADPLAIEMSYARQSAHVALERKWHTL